MKKQNIKSSLVLSIATVAAISAPIVAVISCGGGSTNKHVNAYNFNDKKYKTIQSAQKAVEDTATPSSVYKVENVEYDTIDKAKDAWMKLKTQQDAITTGSFQSNITLADGTDVSTLTPSTPHTGYSTIVNGNKKVYNNITTAQDAWINGGNGFKRAGINGDVKITVGKYSIAQQKNLFTDPITKASVLSKLNWVKDSESGTDASPAIKGDATITINNSKATINSGLISFKTSHANGAIVVENFQTTSSSVAAINTPEIIAQEFSFFGTSFPTIKANSINNLTKDQKIQMIKTVTGAKWRVIGGSSMIDWTGPVNSEITAGQGKTICLNRTNSDILSIRDDISFTAATDDNRVRLFDLLASHAPNSILWHRDVTPAVSTLGQKGTYSFTIDGHNYTATDTVAGASLSASDITAQVTGTFAATSDTRVTNYILTYNGNDISKVEKVLGDRTPPVDFTLKDIKINEVNPMSLPTKYDRNDPEVQVSTKNYNESFSDGALESTLHVATPKNGFVYDGKFYGTKDVASDLLRDTFAITPSNSKTKITVLGTTYSSKADAFKTITITQDKAENIASLTRTKELNSIY